MKETPKPHRTTSNDRRMNGTTRHKNYLKISQIGAVFAAVISSACCWLPLLLLAFGLSGGALSTQFEAWRSILLPVTFLFLGAAFYFTYRRPQEIQMLAEGQRNDGYEEGCSVSTDLASTGACCGRENNRRFTLQRFSKGMLWGVTVLVLGFAFFPNYVGGLFDRGNAFTLREDQHPVALQIDGMTCEACATTLEAALKAIPGVADAAVSFDQKEAMVAIPRDKGIPSELILKAVSDAGFTGRFLELTLWNVTIEGMACEACAALAESKLREVSGVKSVFVRYENKQARIGADGTVTEEAITTAVENAGYQVGVIHQTTEAGQAERNGK